jgi:hypothetical protein
VTSELCFQRVIVAIDENIAGGLTWQVKGYVLVSYNRNQDEK